MDNQDVKPDRIIEGDCIDILKSLPDESIDLIFTDPPYNLQLNQKLWRPNHTLVNAVKDDWEKGLALGFLAGFVGLLLHAFSANTFIIVRIMEPFWFLAAIVVMLPEISALSETDGTQLFAT